MAEQYYDQIDKCVTYIDRKSKAKAKQLEREYYSGRAHDEFARLNNNARLQSKGAIRKMNKMDQHKVALENINLFFRKLKNKRNRSYEIIIQEDFPLFSDMMRKVVTHENLLSQFESNNDGKYYSYAKRPDCTKIVYLINKLRKQRSTEQRKQRLAKTNDC